MVRVGKRLVFLLVACVGVLTCLSMVANAAVITQSDFRLARGVADVGATVAISLEGTVDRDVHTIAPAIRPRPSFFVEQTCRSETNPADVQTATVTTMHPFANHSALTTLTDPGQGQRLRWTVTLSYDPTHDGFLGRFNPAGDGPTICPLAYEPVTPLVVTRTIVRLWPTAGGPPLLTHKGEFLMLIVDVPSGHTELGPQKGAQGPLF